MFTTISRQKSQRRQTSALNHTCFPSGYAALFETTDFRSRSGYGADQWDESAFVCLSEKQHGMKIYRESTSGAIVLSL